jgi:hypothetical protein
MNCFSNGAHELLNLAQPLTFRAVDANGFTGSFRIEQDHCGISELPWGCSDQVAGSAPA